MSVRSIVAALLVAVLLLQSSFAAKSKLVVIIVLDQFPYRYLPKFESYFSESGFKYLMHHGANFTEARYEHATTKTAPGFSTIGTGTYPHVSGIVGNRWYDRFEKRNQEVVDDARYAIVGARGKGSSPANLKSETLGDMMRLASGFRSKAIALSDKDYSAVLLAGKTGMAYWVQDSVLVTSTYYANALPAWASSLNGSGVFQRYFRKWWTEEQPSAARLICDEDDVPYEENRDGLGRAFPHFIAGSDTLSMGHSYYTALNSSPYAAEILFDAARRAVIGESLGTRGVPDLLMVGISGTDEIGHSYGPQSHEVFDNALKTDRMIAEFLSYLDHQLGLNQCLVVLSSDHGIAPIPEYLKKKSPHLDAGRISSKQISQIAETALVNVFGKAPSGSFWVEKVVEGDIYFNYDVLKEKNVRLDDAVRVLKDSLSRQPFVAGLYDRHDVEHPAAADRFTDRVARSVMPGRSGDLYMILKAYYILSPNPAGTNHGQPYEYDLHVPLMFLGEPFIPGTYRGNASPADIIPTLAEVLGIPCPAVVEGRVLGEAIR